MHRILSVLFLVSIFTFSAPLCFAESGALHVCDGVFQSKPCGADQKESELQAKPIRKYQAPKIEIEQAAEEDDAVRASFQPSEISRPKATTTTPRSSSLSELEADLQKLKSDAPRLARQGGGGELTARSSRLFNRVRSVCTTELLQASINNKRRCDQLKKGTADIAGEARRIQ